jgi:DNA topoisomerase VI subunit B
VWNAVDADATKVEIEIERNELGMTAVIVRDNGHGLPLPDAPLLFSKLGGSWKRHGSRSKIKNRMLHGQEGKGRFKAFALGRVVDWSVAY